jgi:hypothetical protein
MKNGDGYTTIIEGISVYKKEITARGRTLFVWDLGWQADDRAWLKGKLLDPNSNDALLVVI